ncbi:MutT/nudix protein, partial [Pseudomonas savastanoi pv. glycinea]
ARFDDAEIYKKPWLAGLESDGATFKAAWHSASSFTSESALVPEGLFDLLKNASLLD